MREVAADTAAWPSIVLIGPLAPWTGADLEIFGDVENLWNGHPSENKGSQSQHVEWLRLPGFLKPANLQDHNISQHLTPVLSTAPGYPLVNSHITLEIHHVEWVNQLFLYISMAMFSSKVLVYQRVLGQ